AGLCIALPVLFFGLRWSHVEAIPLHGQDEGQSLLYLAMKRVALGPIPSGHDVFLHPTAFAGWAGLLMTMLNLIPVGQLDGGHVAYALLGPRADRLSARLRHVLPFVAIAAGAWSVWRARAFGASWQDAREASMFGLIWLIYWVLLSLITRAPSPHEEHASEEDESRDAGLVALFTRRSARAFDVFFGPRAPHPPTEDATLSPARRVLAVFTLALFFLMFTPVPMSSH
ncbi:MAG: site-2 protease family protein, partial [Polyangiales bacterium]